MEFTLISHAPLHQAHLPLSGQAWPHSLLPPTLSACPGHKEQLLNLPVDCPFPRPFPDLPAACHLLAGVGHLAKVPCLLILCQLGKGFPDPVLWDTEVRKRGHEGEKKYPT